ncbi:MAG: VCBS repeat-containing protein [Terriglobia bacterium]
MKPRAITFWILGMLLLLESGRGINDELRGAESPSVRFIAQILDGDFGLGYAVTTADINADGKLDIVAINPTQVVWFENPSWKRHLIMDGTAKKDNVCLAVQDIDGDGRLDIALGAEWMPTNTESGGTLQWLKQPRHIDEPWPIYPITSEPTLHRIRWADIDGDGRKELIVAPLQGRGTKPPNWEKGNGARLMALHVPPHPIEDSWKVEIVDSSMHSLHNFTTYPLESKPAEEIFTASLEGVFLLGKNAKGEWVKRQIGEGNAEEKGIGGAGEIKVGHFRSGKMYLATIEPWHGNQLVIYLPAEEREVLWERKVLDNKLKQGHALWCADLDGDGNDEVVVGWREAEAGKNYGIAVYDPVDDQWNAGRKYLVDDGGMACEDLAVADLNGDGFPEIVASGRATHNLKIYWNQGNEK